MKTAGGINFGKEVDEIYTQRVKSHENTYVRANEKMYRLLGSLVETGDITEEAKNLIYDKTHEIVADAMLECI